MSGCVRLSCVLLAFVFANIKAKAAAPIYERICAFAIVDPLTHKHLGWALHHPMTEEGESPRYSRKLSIAFGPDDSLAINDTREMVIIDPERPHYILRRLPGVDRIVGMQGKLRMTVEAEGRLQEWKLSESDMTRTGISTLRTATSEPNEWSRLRPTPLMSTRSPFVAQASYVTTERTDAPVARILVSTKGDDSVLRVTSLNQVPAITGLTNFFGIHPDLSTIATVQLHPGRIVVSSHFIDGAEPVHREIFHEHHPEENLPERFARLHFSPNADHALVGQYLISNLLDGGKPQRVVRLERASLYSPNAKFSPDSRWLVLPPDDSRSANTSSDQMRIYEVATGQLKATVNLDGLEKVTGVEFSPSSDYLAVTGYSFYPRNDLNRSALFLFSVRAMTQR